MIADGFRSVTEFGLQAGFAFFLVRNKHPHPKNINPMLGLLKRYIKTIIGILLLPLCYSAGSALAIQIQALAIFNERNIFYFAAGAVVFPIMFFFLFKPVRIYVWGHELTHAFFVILSRGKIKQIKLGANSGYVKTDKRNFLISLAPYYFPFYSAIVFVCFHVLTLFVPRATDFFGIYVFLLGFTFAFHIVFTFYVVGKEQEDIKYNGFVFSLVTIFLINELLFGLFLTVPLKGACARSYLDMFATMAVGHYLSLLTFIITKSVEIK